MEKQIVNLRKVLLEKEMNEPKFDFKFDDYTFEGKTDYELKDEDELWK